MAGRFGKVESISESLAYGALRKNPKKDQWEDTFSASTIEPNALIGKIPLL
jgi:hypothetical protein